MSQAASEGGLPRGVAIFLIGVLLLVAVVVIARGLAPAIPQEMGQPTPTPFTQCPATFGGVPVFLVRLSRASYPASTQHIDDARRLLGKPWVLTLDRPGANQRRYAATHTFPRVAGQQPDEYPPAIAREGGVHADVRNIPSGDNQGAGTSMGNQLRSQPDGSLFCIVIT